jgi:hypothetical protein
MPNKFRWSVAKNRCAGSTTWNNHFHAQDDQAAPRSHIGCAARPAPIAVAVGVAAAASGVAEAPSVGTKLVVRVFGMQD